MEEKEKQIRGTPNENEIGKTTYDIVRDTIAKEVSILHNHHIGKWYTSTYRDKSTLVLDMRSKFLGDYSARAEISVEAGGGLTITVLESLNGGTESRIVLDMDNGEMKTFEPGDWMFYFVEQAEKIQNEERERINNEGITQGNAILDEIRRYLADLNVKEDLKDSQRN